MRLAKCKICKSPYHKRSMAHVCCSPACAAKHAKVLRAKRERAETREAKERLKTRSDWLREAQQAVNAYIRERDKDLPCISCGRFHQGQWHAGHYRTVKAAPELRFDESNIHKQCQPCNEHLSGNIVEYRLRLIQKVGQAEVDRIEGHQAPVKWTIEDAKRIKAEYKDKLKMLKLERQRMAA